MISQPGKSICSVLIGRNEELEPPKPQDLQKKLETGNEEEKLAALRELLICILNDESYPKLMMVVFRSILPLKTENHEFKKVMLLYWEVIDKLNADGSLKDEFYLVNNHFRNDILHANEYIRGRTLRLLTRVMLKDVIMPLISSIVENLTYKNVYVRRAAVTCLYHIFLNYGTEFLPDIDDTIYDLLVNEPDLSTRRNAFLFLFNSNMDKALSWLQEITKEESEELGDLLQLVILEALRKTSKFDKTQRPRLNKFILFFSKSKSPSVAFECACTLMQVSTSPTFIKAALDLLLGLLETNSDNNIKLIILEKLQRIKSLSVRQLEEKIPSLINVLNNEDYDIKLAALSLIQPLLSAKHIKSMSSVFNQAVKALPATGSAPITTGATIFRSNILHTFSQIISKTNEFNFSQVQSICQSLIALPKLDDGALKLIQTIILKALGTPESQKTLLKFLLENFGGISNVEFYKIAFYFFAHSAKEAEVEECLNVIKREIGPLPLEARDPEANLEKTGESGNNGEETQHQKPTQKKTKVKTVVLPDGTYGTVTVQEEAPHSGARKPSETISADENGLSGSPLREFIIKNQFLSSSLIVSLVRLTLRLPAGLPTLNKHVADVLLLLCAIGKLHQSSSNPDKTLLQRISFGVHILTDPKSFTGQMSPVCQLFIKNESPIGRIDLEIDSIVMNSADQLGLEELGTFGSKSKPIAKQVDDSLQIRQLKGKEALNELDLADEEVFDPDELMGQGPKEEVDFTKSLLRLVQLTGRNDPIYAECFVHMNKYDIQLDILLVNNTPKQIQNVTVSFTSPGETKILENSSNVTFQQKITIASGASTMVKQAIKLNSNEFGVIYPSITYENYAGISQENLITNEIVLDVIEFVYPAPISIEQFRFKWYKYEWENKVIVNSHITDPIEFIQKVAEGIKGYVLTDLTTLTGCQFIVANIYARTKLGRNNEIRSRGWDVCGNR